MRDRGRRRTGRWVVFLIAVTSVAIVAISASLLRSHREGPSGTPDTAHWLRVILVFATVAAALFGIAPLFVWFFADFAGYHGTDVFLYRQAAAATFGYALMGVFELRLPRWEEIQLPLIIGLVFNGTSFLASLAELNANGLTLLVRVVGPASLLFSIGFIAALARKGR